MFTWGKFVVEESLKKVAKTIDYKISVSELEVVNSYLPDRYQKVGEGLRLRSIRPLDDDEKTLFCYLFLEQQGVRSNNEYEGELEKRDLMILDLMFDRHCEQVITSSFIRERMIGTVITKNFWLCAIVFDSKEAMFQYKLQESAERASLIAEKIEETQCEIVHDLKIMKLVANCAKNIATPVPVENQRITKEIPGDFSTNSLEEAVKRVFDVGGHFANTSDGCLRAVDSEGKDLIFGTGEVTQKFVNSLRLQELIKKYSK